MAAAIIPLVSMAIGAIGPQIPTIVQFVEDLFGHSSNTGKQDGPVKMDAAVQMLTAALTSLANAGKIPSAPVVDPSLPAGLVGAIQQAVNALKAQGALGDAAVPMPNAIPNAVPLPFLSGSWTVTATVAPK